MWGQAQFEETRHQIQKQPVVGQWKPLAAGTRGQELQQLEPPAKDCDNVDDNQSMAQLNVSRLRSSSVEILEKGSEFLKEELRRAQKHLWERESAVPEKGSKKTEEKQPATTLQMETSGFLGKSCQHSELKLKDEECERLSKVREQLEQELEELTASLFEEAHKMVREANTKQAASEKQLREARGKIDMLQAEVTALKTLVITSTPSSPNRELHPQLQSPSKATFRKGHGRNKSTSSAVATAGGQSTPSEPVSSEFKEAIHITYEPGWQSLATDSSFSSPSRQVDSILFTEFQAWKESPSLDKACPFLERIYQEDVGPCLDFTKHELSELVQAAVEQNTLTIEPVATQALPVVKVSAIECGGPNGFRSQIVTKCALSGLSRACRHRIKLGDSGNYYYISPSCRARITAVGNFFTYIRYIQQGLVRQDVELMYWEIMRLRKEMSLAKLGFYSNEM